MWGMRIFKSILVPRDNLTKNSGFEMKNITRGSIAHIFDMFTA